MTKLYELNYGDHFMLEDDRLSIPPDAPEVSKDITYKFLGVDGMYGKIKQEGQEMAYVAAWTEVRKV